MEASFALASFKAYAFDIFVWLCIGIPVLFFIYTILKRRPLFILIFGILVTLSAIPIGLMSELSVNGCCGTPSTGHEGVGYLIGGAVAIIGLLIIVFRNKLAEERAK